jgi:hypothetical protein
MTRTDDLRPILDDMGRELSRFTTRVGGGQDPTALMASWAKVVDFLALGPARELAKCPYCRAVGSWTATRCGHCWKKLPPLT